MVVQEPAAPPPPPPPKLGPHGHPEEPDAGCCTGPPAAASGSHRHALRLFLDKERNSECVQLVGGRGPGVGDKTAKEAEEELGATRTPLAGAGSFMWSARCGEEQSPAEYRHPASAESCILCLHLL